MAVPLIETREAVHSDADVREVPRRADGVDLIGLYQGSGYREPKYIVGRGDGQIIQLPHLLFALASLLDGRRDTEQLAAALSAETDRGISADQVEFLVRERLRPAGIAEPPETGPGAAPAAVPAARPDPFLALRFRAPLCSARVTWVIAGVFQVLFRAPVLVAVLAGFVALDVGLLVAGAAGRIVPAATALIYQPALTLLVLGTVFLCLSFHEFGHAAACRYGGARPGTMGVGLYLIWPAVYTTVTDAYRLPRGGRLRTDLGGVYFNVIFISGLSAAYLATGRPWLLLAIVLLHLETASQFLPTVRFDGYYILSDLIGLPDLFMFLGPVVRSAVPGRAVDPRVEQLRPWVRRVITFWVLAVIPCLLLMLAAFLAVAPHTLPVLFQVIGELATATGDAVRAGDTATATLGVLQLVFVALPWVGSVLIVWMIGGQIRDAVLARRRRAAAPRAPVGARDATPATGTVADPTGAPEPAAASGPGSGAATEPATVSIPVTPPRRPADPAAPPGPRQTAAPTPAAGASEQPSGRPAGWFLVAVIAAVAVTGVALAAAGSRGVSAAESVVAAAAGAARAPGPVPGPDIPAVTAFGVRQLAALDTLVAGVGFPGVVDGVRAALLVAALVGALLVWPAARRSGLSGPASAAAVVLAVVPAPVLLLHATVDPAVVAAVWLTAAAAVAGRHRAVTVVALLLAVLTAPPAAVAVAAFATHRRLRRPADHTRARRLRTAACVATAAPGLVVAALAVPPGGPLRAIASAPVPVSVLVILVVAGVGGAALAWSRGGTTAPLATGAVVLLLWAVLDRGAAGSLLVLAIPAVSVLLAAGLDVLRPRIGRLPAQLAVTAVVLGSVASSWPTVLASFTTVPRRDTTAAWIRTETGAATVRTDPLTALELVRAGADPARLAPLDGPAPAGALVAGSELPDTGPAGGPGEVLFTEPSGPDGAPVVVRAAPAPGVPDAEDLRRAARAELGGQVAGAPGLTCEGSTCDELVRGDVDDRLALVLSDLLRDHQLTVSAFPSVPGEPDGVPRRIATIRMVNGLSVTVPGVAEPIVGTLEGRFPRDRPDRAEVDPRLGALVVHFPVDVPGASSR